MKHQVMLEVTEHNGHFTFRPHSNLWHPDSSYAAGGKFVFNKNSHSGMKEDECHYIHFRLHPTHNAGLSFAAAKNDAMWVIRPTPGHECPVPADVPHNIDYSVMGPHRRESDSELIAYNRNMDMELWSFSLNFVTSSGTPVYWDPVGDNQDGGHPVVSRSLLIYTGIALGAGIISAVATTALVGAFT